jgi:hypothetical protein
MKNPKNKLPKTKIQPLYRFKKQNGFTETTTLAGDPTNTTTILITTTHF